MLEGLGTNARPSHVIDTAGGGWLVRKYALRPPTPPYLREGLARVDRLAPPASPSLLSDLSDATDRLDELLLRASPAGSSSIASDVVAELNDLQSVTKFVRTVHDYTDLKLSQLTLSLQWCFNASL